MEIASYNLINEILKALNNKSKVGGISFDLGKAFDCVNQIFCYPNYSFVE